MAENTRYQTAKACAGEAIDALYSVYWADSFDSVLLEARLAETIHFFARNARSLAESQSNSAASESEGGDEIAPAQQERGDSPFKSANLPLIDLRDQPSPDILRLLAIGSPEVVNSCVMTLYQLRYARPEEWSRPLPTVNPGEVMRILSKRVRLTE